MLQHQTILAIDPGASGGIAYKNSAGVSAIAMPDDMEQRDLVASLAKSNNIVCYLELVGGFIRGSPAPGSAMFNFGDGYGFTRGLLAALRVKTVLVRPQAWQKGIPGLGGPDRPAHKRALKEQAVRLFPDLKVTLKTADALCILDYGERAEQGYAGTNAHQKQQAQEAEENAASAPVANPKQIKAARAWCKANHWPCPPTGTKQFLQMFDYWKSVGAP